VSSYISTYNGRGKRTADGQAAGLSERADFAASDYSPSFPEHSPAERRKRRGPKRRSRMNSGRRRSPRRPPSTALRLLAPPSTVPPTVDVTEV